MTDALSWIEISKSTLEKNVAFIRSHLKTSTKLMAMVKANAYGHGIEIISQALAPIVDWFGVNTIDEALVIRKLGIKNPILIAGPIPQSEFETAAKNNISLAAHSLDYLTKLQKYPIKIHLKINTGMNRLGILPNEIPKSIQNLEGVYTHFHSADSSKSSTNQQLEQFLSVRYPGAIRHAANSAATLNFPQSHLDMVRIGIAIYSNVLTWNTKVVQTRTLNAGETVGYSATYKVKNHTYTAVVPVGYSDGLDRGLSNTGNFIGRIAMNYSVIKTTKLLKEGDVIELIGPNITSHELANKINTIDYEIISRLNPKIKRILIK